MTSKNALPAGFRVVCSVCGESREAETEFAGGQLKKKHPRCRSCAPNKFSNQAQGGHQSRKEDKHAVNLRALASVGILRNFQEQVRFEVIPRQDVDGKLAERACHYVADFVYDDQDGVHHVVDAKGWRTPEYRLKRKLMLFIHKIRIEEV
jgi:hypothetical protein